jgi:hypothetical protein
MKKIISIGAVGAVALTAVLLPYLSFAAAFSTTTLGDNIDSLSGQANDMFVVMIAKYWPFVLGGLILSGVIGFAIWLVLRFFHR